MCTFEVPKPILESFLVGGACGSTTQMGMGLFLLLFWNHGRMDGFFESPYYARSSFAIIE